MSCCCCLTESRSLEKIVTSRTLRTAMAQLKNFSFYSLFTFFSLSQTLIYRLAGIFWRSIYNCVLRPIYGCVLRFIYGCVLRTCINRFAFWEWQLLLLLLVHIFDHFICFFRFRVPITSYFWTSSISSFVRKPFDLSRSGPIIKLMFFTKLGHSRPLFLYFHFFNTVDNKQMFNKSCRNWIWTCVL